MSIADRGGCIRSLQIAIDSIRALVPLGITAPGTQLAPRTGVVGRRPTRLPEEMAMLYWAIVFLVVAIIAGLLGFTTIAGASIAIAKFLAVLFLIVFLVLLVMGRGARRI
jgi:uncharacterized membrane protein YtjA (UPF0391 family)